VSGHMRSSPSAASRSALQRTPSLEACVAAADRWVRAQVVLLQLSGSRSQTCWYLHLPLWRCLETVQEPFSYPVRRFLHAQDWCRHHRCQRRGTRPVNGHHHRGWPSDLFSFLLGLELGGNPVDTCLYPWLTVRPVGCTPVTLYSTLYKLLCSCQ
jgi:hypothetical protein